MKSLTDLNNHSQTSIEFADDRGSKVVFDRVFPLQPLNITDEITSTTVAVTPGIEIVDIINYTTANVRFRVNIVTGSSPLLTGSTLTFGTLPSGVILNVSGSTYTFSGITTIAHWNAIKNFTWNLPANFNSCPLWYLDVAVLYYDSARNEEMVVDWEIYDPLHYFIAQLEAASTLTTIIGKIRRFTATLSSQASVEIPGSGFFRAQAAITSTATVIANVEKNVTNLQARITMSATVGVRKTYIAGISAQASLTANMFLLVKSITNRTYGSNTYTKLFALNTPVVYTQSPADTVSITLSSSTGQWGANKDAITPVNTLTITALASQMTALLAEVVYFPTKGATATFTYTWLHSVNSVTQFTATRSVTTSGTGSMTSEVLSVTSTLAAWTPTYAQGYYFGKATMLIIGAGGNGGDKNNIGGGGGGGAGQFREISSVTITAGTAYNLVVGESSSFIKNSSAFGITAIGGVNGGQGYTTYGGQFIGTVYRGGNGGASGNGFAGSTGSGYGGTPGGDGGGGGGSGGASSGGNSNGPQSGGLGTYSTILRNNIRYAAGGQGGGAPTRFLGGNSGLPGAANTGNGGNGGYTINGGAGGAGGSGYIYLRFFIG